MICKTSNIQAAVHMAAAPFQKTQGLNRLSKLFLSTLDIANCWWNTDAIPVIQTMALAAGNIKRFYPLFIKPWNTAKTWICASPGKTLWQNPDISRAKLLQTTLKTLKVVAKILQVPFLSAAPYISAIAPALPAATHFLSLTNSTIDWCRFGQRVWRQGTSAVVEECCFWKKSYEKLVGGYTEKERKKLIEEHEARLTSLKNTLQSSISGQGNADSDEDDNSTIKLETKWVNEQMTANQLFLMTIGLANEKNEERERLLQYNVHSYLQCLKNKSTSCERELEAYTIFLGKLETSKETTRNALLQYLSFRLNNRDTTSSGLHQKLFDLIHKIEEEEYMLALLQSKDDVSLAIKFCSQMENRAKNELMSQKLAWIHTAKQLAQIAAATLGLASLCVATPIITAPLFAANLAAHSIGMAEFLYKENFEQCRKSNLN